MSRPKSLVPLPAWVTQQAHARRANDLPHELRPALAVPRPVLAPMKPILVASNAAPVDKDLIGYERPKLATSNGHPLLPDNDYRMP